jgi:hypothetical protein
MVTRPPPGQAPTVRPCDLARISGVESSGPYGVTERGAAARSAAACSSTGCPQGSTTDDDQLPMGFGVGLAQSGGRLLARRGRRRRIRAARRRCRAGARRKRACRGRPRSGVRSAGLSRCRPAAAGRKPGRPCEPALTAQQSDLTNRLRQSGRSVADIAELLGASRPRLYRLLQPEKTGTEPNEAPAAPRPFGRLGR